MANVFNEYKNNVFCLLYQDRKNLLSLYNAVNGTDYTDESELTVVTLESAILMRMHNDAAFVIDSGLNLYEQQASVNPNIPLRNLYYVTEELKKLIPTEKLYGKTAVRFPAPRFVTFYNGTEEQPGSRIFRLSDLYETAQGNEELELSVRQININKGYNDDILEKCESLKGYMTFVDKVRGRKAAGDSVQKAVEASVDECIAENVLTVFFKAHRGEVIEMGIYEFDAEAYERVIKAESYEDGYKEGKTEGKAEGELTTLLEQVCRKLAKGKTPEETAEELEEDIAKIRYIYTIAAEFAPNYDREKILERLRQRSAD